MKLTPRYLAVAVLAALAPAAHAEIAVDVIGGSEVSLEGLMQADGNWFHNDVLDLNAPSSNNDGKDTEFEQRRAEVVLKGKGTSFDWVVGYDGKNNKWLDVNLKWKLGTSYLQAGQFKQPNSMEELASTKNNDFVSKAMVTNLFGLSRRVGVAWGDDQPNYGYNVSYFGR
ncbi:MAG TPA: porin, partial [Rhodanobacteraceae bacterium]|nr:porin [Rhodanobacteraceae bacterium]